MIATFGNASGTVPPFTAIDLMRAGSVFVTRPTLSDYCATAQEMQGSARRLFEVITSGAVRVRVGQTFPLSCAAEAHRALEQRATTGSTLIIPDS
jgi:NADPH2:quinone reductase